MNKLIAFLGEQRKVTNGGGSNSAGDLKKQIEKEHVYLNFADTEGQTDLCMRLDVKNTDLTKSDFLTGKGFVHLEGEAILNFEKVRCVADISLENLEGLGSLKSKV